MPPRPTDPPASRRTYAKRGTGAFIRSRTGSPSLPVTLALLALLAIGGAAPAGYAAERANTNNGEAASSRPITLTTAGPIRGVQDEAVDRYRGIPYAAPPVGDLRWRAPQPTGSWLFPRDAGESGSPCPQLAEGKQLPGSDEDCLYLDVTMPRARGAAPGSDGQYGTEDRMTGAGKPVMVWLHGGSNTMGSGSEFDPARMASTGDVVVVTLNYRLGTLGFFGYDGLAGSGSFGLQDQQAALRWVKQNAVFFGGDPSNVTLFGESAGGVDTCAHLTSPTARGLFDKAILQSGGCDTRIPTAAVGKDVAISHDDFWTPLEQLRASGSEVAKELGCVADDSGRQARQEVLDCLRKLPPKKLLPYEFSFGIAEGTRTLPTNPGTAVSEGRFHRVPVLSGNTRDESRYTTMLLEAATGPITEQRYDALLEQAFGTEASTIRAAYPSGEYDSPGLAFAAMDTDRAFACPQLRTNRGLAREVPTYGFEFADRTAPSYAPFFTDMPPGASHASELAYLFDLAIGPWGPDFNEVELTQRQRVLADEMIGAWTRFARTGSPAGPDSWPEFGDGRGQSVYAFVPDSVEGADSRSTGSGPVDAWDRHHCDLWSGLSERS